MKLKWHPLAIQDLTTIVDYCKASFGVSIALKVKWRITDSVKLLKHHPRLAPVEHQLDNCTSLQYRGLMVGSQTKVIYSVHADYVYIHLLWDVRQEEEKLGQTLLQRYSHLKEGKNDWLNEPYADYETGKR